MCGSQRGWSRAAGPPVLRACPGPAPSSLSLWSDFCHLWAPPRRTPDVTLGLTQGHPSRRRIGTPDSRAGRLYDPRPPASFSLSKIKENRGQGDYLHVGYFCSLTVSRGNTKVSQALGQDIHNTCAQQPRSQDVGGTPKNQRGKSAVHQGPRTEAPTHRALEQKWQISVAPESPAPWVSAPGASLVQMERGAERGALGTGGCSPGTPPPPPPPHMEGNESAGTGLFLLGFLVWVSLLLPLERAGSVWGCGKQLQEPESNPLGVKGEHFQMCMFLRDCFCISISELCAEGTLGASPQGSKEGGTLLGRSSRGSLHNLPPHSRGACTRAHGASPECAAP